MTNDRLARTRGVANIGYADIIERHAIHAAVCRARSSGLRCATCSDFAESATRARRTLAAQTAQAA